MTNNKDTDIERLKQAFALFDRDRDGEINKVFIWEDDL